MTKFDDCEFPSCLGTLVYIINSGFLFVVCLSRTMFGKKKVPTCIRQVGNMVTGIQG